MQTAVPAVTIHSLDEGDRVLRFGWPVTILSAPGAALYAGPGWWRAVVAELQARHPDAPFIEVLDCADAPGRAAEALRAGQRRILFRPESAALLASVSAMADACAAEIWTERPPALDMATRGAERQLAAWLAGPSASG